MFAANLLININKATVLNKNTGLDKKMCKFAGEYILE